MDSIFSKNLDFTPIFNLKLANWRFLTLPQFSCQNPRKLSFIQFHSKNSGASIHTKSTLEYSLKNLISKSRVKRTIIPKKLVHVHFVYELCLKNEPVPVGPGDQGLLGPML